MDTQNQGPELWRRKFEPFSDWRPASESSPGTSIYGAALEDSVAKAKESLMNVLKPVAEEARGRIKGITSALDDVAAKSSNDIRSFVAKSLESMAEMIRPK